MLPTAVTPENAPVSDRNEEFQEFLRTFEIASRIKKYHNICLKSQLFILFKVDISISLIYINKVIFSVMKFSYSIRRKRKIK